MGWHQSVELVSGCHIHFMHALYKWLALMPGMFSPAPEPFVSPICMTVCLSQCALICLAARLCDCQVLQVLTKAACLPA